MQSNGADGNLLRGTLDFLLLASLEHGPLYGLRIIQDVQHRTAGHFNFKEGTLYPALHRLEKRALIQAEIRPSDTGGPPRKYYHLTSTGLSELARQRDAQRAHARALRPYLEFA
ncbi:PadR family transcriptional regulator [Deinococcus soli (ex Cha et al. 2016)]|uniref:DNA-binding PadR family transcriptional regulator n=2 Tax=Deinococcus soli (ex Cha et al. 2016) TaxID=1309411 RepID=A0ACC6KQH2_9DEIO|nr:PadR family transcriptional regulator [Deinococcus soli (ex Cha et al. 2016)]MDR6221541.1 DNA-binding PadR family transcriptional regulator [Deinococcus soli (ex Cha et al. 2016)]MDR6331519.1 DNA-binding PadR family transcriptional regulator [Deinococcus soli (ex Cha et al. 2016)]MDR6754689.1 DNA-binding PadR family transcriptional regulator [Deinococcus soli (ex Cha et al. 2016)]